MQHEEYFEEDDEEIGYQEDVVISESNHTIPNYDEANEIKMLTEAANNSLKTMEEHFNPPKKARSRKKKNGEPSVDDGVRPKKRRRPPHLYFNELGEPASGRTQALLKGLEHLNLPIATAGTAPISPPSSRPEPEICSFKANVKSPSLVAEHAVVQTPSSQVPFQSRPLRMPQKTPPDLSIPHMLSPQMLSPNIKSPRMVSPSLISPRLMSPGQQPPQLSPRTVSATQKKHPLLSTILSVTSPGAQGLSSNVSPPSAGLALNQMVRMPSNAPVASFPFPPRAKGGDYQSQQTATTGRQDHTASALAQVPVRQPTNVPQHQITHPRLPSSVQSAISTPLQRSIRPDFAKPNYMAAENIFHSPRFQQVVSSIPTNIQPIPAQLPPVSQVAVLPSEVQSVNVPKSVPQVVPSEQAATGSSQQNDLNSPHRPGKTTENISGLIPGQLVPNTVMSQGSNDPKPKIQELIKSELLAAAWQSRQPMQAVTAPGPLPEKKIETNTLSTTISRVEERLKQAAAEAQKQRPELSKPSNSGLPPAYTSSANLTGVTRLQPPTPVSARFPPPTQTQGSTLPPISTLQTKLPPGLVPSTLPATSNAGLTLHTTSSVVTKLPSTFGSSPAPTDAQVLESPPVTEDREMTNVLSGQIPVPRGALKSPVLSSGLGKDPMLSGSSLPMPGAQQSGPQTNTDTFRNPMQPLLSGRLPAPFPLAFAPGLPPVGLMMQPIPPLGFGRSGAIAQGRPSVGEILNTSSMPSGIPMNSVPSGHSSPRLQSPTADKHKILSSTLQSPPVSQPNPLDLIMEVMKKEMNTNSEGTPQGQLSKDTRYGVKPQTGISSEKGGPPGPSVRLPTPGPTMEMLMAIMQREVAAAQIQAQVAALHAAHAQVQAQASQVVGGKVAGNPVTSVSQVTRPAFAAPDMRHAQAKLAQAEPVKPTLPPVSTVMPTTPVPPPISIQVKSPKEPSSLVPIPSTSQTTSVTNAPSEVMQEEHHLSILFHCCDNRMCEN